MQLNSYFLTNGAPVVVKGLKAGPAVVVVVVVAMRTRWAGLLECLLQVYSDLC